MSIEPRRSLRIRSNNVPANEPIEEEKKEKKKRVPKRTIETVEVDKKRSKKITADKAVEVEDEELDDTDDQTMEDKPGANSELKDCNDKNESMKVLSNVDVPSSSTRPRRNCANKMIKEIESSDSGSDMTSSESSLDSDVEKDMKRLNKMKGRSKKTTRNHSLSDSSNMEMNEEDITQKKTKKKEKPPPRKRNTVPKNMKNGSIIQAETRPELCVMRNKKYDVNIEEILEWEEKAKLMKRRMNQLLKDVNNSGEIMEKVNDFVGRCLKGRTTEMGDIESVKACYVLEDEFTEFYRKKKMNVAQRIKEKVDGEMKAMYEDDVDDHEEEEEDEWEAMEAVDGDGEVKLMQVRVPDNGKDMSSHWKSKWLRAEVNRIMRHRYESIHKTHLLCYISHLRRLVYLCTSASNSWITVAARALSLLPVNIINEKDNKLDKVKKWFEEEFKLRNDSIDSYSQSNRIEELIGRKEYINEMDAVMLFFSFAVVLGLHTRIVMRCSVVSKKVPQSPSTKGNTKKTVKVTNEKKSKKEVKEDVKSTYWCEVWDDNDKKWIVVDVFPPQNGINDILYPHIELIDKTNKYSNVIYFLAIDNDYGIRDVSARYLSPADFVSKEFRTRRVNNEWWEEVLMNEKWKADYGRSRLEDKEWKMNLRKQPMPTTVAAFKDHPLYVLEKDVLKLQVIFPYDTKPIGLCRGHKIFDRCYVRPIDTLKQYEKMGRQIKEGEHPCGEKNVTNPFTGESGKLGLYGYWQTEPFDNGVVKEGRVPRNEFDNVYMYQPEMCPPGGIHLIPSGLQRVALELGKDCVPAIVGWQFKGGNTIPIIRGAVYAKDGLEELINAWKISEKKYKEDERKRKSEEALSNWKRFISGMLRLDDMRRKFVPMERMKGQKTDEAVLAEEAAAWPSRRYGGDIFE